MKLQGEAMKGHMQRISKRILQQRKKEEQKEYEEEGPCEAPDQQDCETHQDYVWDGSDGDPDSQDFWSITGDSVT